MLKTVDIEITGIQPLLVHRFQDENAQPKATRKVRTSDTVDTRAEALKAANVTEDGRHYLSSFAVIGAMTNAGANHKMVGSRKSLRFIVPSAVRWPVDAEPILEILVEGVPARDFIVDARPVTIPATKGRIMRYRPRYEGWTMRFRLLVDTSLMSVEMAHTLLNEAGVQIGIGDFRPEKRGPFGTFRVTRFEVIEEETEENSPAAATSTSAAE